MSQAVSRDPTVRNVVLLAICQGLAMSTSALTISVASLVGYSLAVDKSLATMPLFFQFAAVMVVTIPASLFMKRFGRRAGLSLGAAVGMVSGLLSAWAIFESSFTLFCVGAFLFGISVAHAFYYRFAAADTASATFKSKAIALVLAGGLVAAFLGPELAKWSKDLFAPVLFAGGYLAISVLLLASLVILQFIRIPRTLESMARGGRPLLEIVRQPRFIIAVLCATTGYGAMNLVMTATPLAVIACNHPFESAAFVIQWHVVAMFAPSFFTGHLIQRFGVAPLLIVGTLLILGCVAVNLSGVEVAQFWAALVLLGLGWNFLFVGATALLTETYRPAEKAKVQGLNDFLVFGTVALTALTSGALFDTLGWEAVNLAVVVPVLAAGAAALWLGRQHHPAAA